MEAREREAPGEEPPVKRVREVQDLQFARNPGYSNVADRLQRLRVITNACRIEKRGDVPIFLHDYEIQVKNHKGELVSMNQEIEVQGRKRRIRELRPQERKQIMLEFQRLLQQNNQVTIACDVRKTLYSFPKMLPTPPEDGVYPLEVQLDDRKSPQVFFIRAAMVKEMSTSALFGRGDAARFELVRAVNIAVQWNQAVNMLIYNRTMFNSAREIDDRDRDLPRNFRFPRGVKMYRGAVVNVNATGTESTLLCDPVVGFFWPGGISFIEALQQREVLDKSGIPIPPGGKTDPITNLNRILRKLKFRLSYFPMRVRVVRSITKDTARSHVFDCQGTQMSVEDYYERKKEQRLRYPNAPLVAIRTERNKHNQGQKLTASLIPMEFCILEPHQRIEVSPMSKEVIPRENLIETMLKIRTERPQEAQRRVEDFLRTVVDQIQQPLADGMQLVFPQASRLAEIDARVFTPPNIRFGRDEVSVPRDGAWNFNRNQLYKPIKLEQWAVVELLSYRDNRGSLRNTEELAHALTRKMGNMGIAVEGRPFMEGPFRDVREMIRMIHERCGSFQIVVVILPGLAKLPEYHELKEKTLLASAQAGVPTQCILGGKYWNPKQGANGQDQYLANVILKINMKALPPLINGGPQRGERGVNFVVENPFFGQSAPPFMIFGIDVLHQKPGSGLPSIAAVVASLDEFASQHLGRWRAQVSRHEFVVELQEMVYELIVDFLNEHNGVFPQRVLIFRDGVGDGAFAEILDREHTAIRAAFEGARHLAVENGLPEPFPMPTFTFTLVQKKHHVRFFPAGREHVHPRNGNLLPGVAVSNTVVDENLFGFYLLSHAGILGTVRFARYNVLIDENGFHVDQFQRLCYDLCHLYVKCTRSVSIIPAVFYADRLATLANALRKGLDETGSVSSGGFGFREDPQGPDPFQNAVASKLHGNIAFGMFFA